MSKLISERQAWLYLEKRIKANRLRGETMISTFNYAWSYGLCGCILHLVCGSASQKPKISDETRDSMSDKIKNQLSCVCPYLGFKWPRGDLYHRELFCRKQAAILGKKKKSKAKKKRP